MWLGIIFVACLGMAIGQSLPVQSKVVTLIGNRPTTVRAVAASDRGMWVAGTTFADGLGLPGAYQPTYSATATLGLYTGGVRRPLANIPDKTIRGLIAHPSDLALLYCLTEFGFYRSRDAGRSFELLKLPESLRAPIFSVSAGQPGLIYAQDQYGIIPDPRYSPLFFSIDFGASWELVNASPPGPLARVDGTAPCVVYVVAARRLHRSEDCGRTWGLLSVPLVVSVTGDPRMSGRLVVLASSSIVEWHLALYFSENGGNDWRVQPLDIPLTEIAVDPRIPGRLYGVLPGEVLASDDSGRTWNRARRVDEGVAGPTFRLVPDFLSGSVFLIRAGRVRETRDSFASLEEVAVSPRDIISIGAAGLLFQQADHSPDAFLAHFNHAGDLTAFTYLGGDGTETVTAVAVDPAGDVLISGTTNSRLFPFTQSMDRQGSGYLVKFSGDAARLNWATRLPFAAATIVTGKDGSHYLGGTTSDVRLPTTPGAIQADFANAIGTPVTNGFVARLRSDGVTPIYLTYYGAGPFGGAPSAVNALAVDDDGNAYAAGVRYNALPFMHLPEIWKIGPLGTALHWEGGSGHAQQVSTWTMASGYLAAGSALGVLPAFSFSAARSDAVVTRLNDRGEITFAQQFGGDRDDRVTAMAVDADGNAILAGYTESDDFPTRSLIEGRTATGLAFVTKFNHALSEMFFSTYLNDFTPVGIVSHPDGGWWLAGTNQTAEGIKLIHLTETDATLPRVDALLRTGVIVSGLTSTLRGAGFAEDARVIVGDSIAPSRWVSPSQIVFSRPVGLTPGRYSLRVELPDGRASARIAVQVR